MTNRVVSVDETFALPAPVRTKLQSDLGATAPAHVLGMTVHNPTTQVEIGNVNGTTLTAIDPANLSVTFTAPASGKVTVEMEAEVTESAGIANWGVVIAGAPAPGATARVCGPIATGSGSRYGVTVLVQDLTPGATYTAQWGTAAAGTLRLRVGGTGAPGSAMSGPAVMTVRDAPF